MVRPPIVRDFAVIKSTVPFPTTNNSQVGAPQDRRRQRTGSNSSTSSSELGSYPLRSPNTSMSGRAQKQLSPVVEECEDDPSRTRWTTGPRVGSRTGHRPRPTSYIGHTGLIAEDITVAMMSMMPPPARHQTKTPARQRTFSRARSRFQNLRQSIRVRLPTMRVWKRR